jgi:hypothetical protein
VVQRLAEGAASLLLVEIRPEQPEQDVAPV